MYVPLFRDPASEQRRWVALEQERRRREDAARQMSPEVAQGVATIKRKYPWVPTSLAATLVTSGHVDDETTERMAHTIAGHRTRRSRWSQIGDVVSGAGKAVGGVAAEVGGAVGRGFTNTAEGLLGGPPGAGGGATAPQRKAAGAQRLDELGEGAKATARAGFLVAQTPLEAVVGEVRSTISSGEGPMGGQLGIRTPERSAEVAGQTTLGAAMQQQAEEGRVDLGHGFFPAGEAAKRQAANSRAVLSVDGHAWTPGRAVAHEIFEPGSKPYTLLSGTIDAAVTWYGDPGARAGKLAGEAKAAKGVLSTLEGEAQVARAAKKADPEWRKIVEEARGAVHGDRPTVVPRVVDKYLYSDEWKGIAEKVAETRSPTEIWRAFDKKMPVELAVQASRSADPAEITRLFRPHLGLDVLPGDVGGLGMKVTHDLQGKYRGFNVMPDTHLPWDDPDTFVRNLDNSLANAKVMGEKRRAILDEAFDALVDNSPGRRKRLLDVASGAVKESLVGHGVDEDMATRLSSWVNESDKIRHFLTDDLGRDVNFSFLLDDAGNPIRTAKPAALIDLLNSGTFLYDPTAVRQIRSLTRTVKVLNNPAFQMPLSVVNFMQQELWKMAATMRPAYIARVNGEEVARSLSSGSFDTALDYLNFVAFHRGEATAGGGLHDILREADDIAERLTGTVDDATRAKLSARLQEINDQVVKGKTEYERAKVGRAWKHDSYDSIERNMVRSGNWATVHKDSDPRRWRLGLADETIAMSKDPVIKRVANGGLFPGDEVTNPRPGIDGIKDWLRDGAGQKFRKDFEDAFPGVDFTAEAVLDDVIDKARLRVEKLGDNADLRGAVATGRLNGKPISTANTRGPETPADYLLDRLEEWRQNPNAPQMQKYEQLEEVASRARRDLDTFIGYRDRVREIFFGTFYGKTSDWLARSPVFRAEYWNHIENLMIYLDEPSRAKVLENAEEWGKLGKKRMARLVERSKAPVGEVAYEDADRLARGWALDKTGELLFDASERSQFFDATRAAFPFGEAWKEVLGRYMKLAVERPQVPRRFQQIVQGARGAGFFHRDPATGEEVFSYPLPGPVADYLGIDMSGSVQGLSLGTAVIPGLGPAGQLTLKKILPNKPSTDFIRALAFPYGEPQSVQGSFTPGWAAKAYAAADGDESNRVLANSYFEVMRQLVASGDYGVTRAEKQRLLDDAWTKARQITGLRALAQAILPSAPMISYRVPLEGADQVSGLLVKDFAKMMADEQEGKIDSATAKFLDKYGDDAFVYMVGKTRSEVGGQKASVAYGKWERENGDLIKKYKEVAGYFGPQQEGFDSTVFQRQINAGNREYRDPSEALDEAQSLVASWIYRNLRAQITGTPSKAQSAQLRAAKKDLIEDYPGWNPDAVPGNLPKRIRALMEAKGDPKIRDTEIGKALNIYFTKRDEAITAAGGSGLQTLKQAKGKAGIRRQLRSVGDDLAEDFPQFRGVWRDLLAYEFKDDDDGR